MASEMEVTPAMLIWARKSARLSASDAADALKVEESVVDQWESGSRRPTAAQLHAIARVYRRPTSIFFLPAPPKKSAGLLRDFRVLDGSALGTPSRELADALSDAEERQKQARYLAEEIEFNADSRLLSLRLGDDVELAARKVRAALEIDDALRGLSGDEIYRAWRVAIERQGILTFQFPLVPVVEARGFALTDRPLPAIGVNSQDATAAKLFTLAHELAHILVRNPSSVTTSVVGSSREEVFCNALAAALLVPRDQLESLRDVRAASARTTWTTSQLQEIANGFGVSREVVLRRLLTLGRTNPGHYSSIRASLLAERSAKPRKGGGHYYNTQVSRIGYLFRDIVLDAYTSQKVTLIEASHHLGFKAPKVLEYAGKGRTATRGDE